MGADHLDIRPSPQVIIDGLVAEAKRVILSGIDANAIPIGSVDDKSAVYAAVDSCASACRQ